MLVNWNWILKINMEIPQTMWKEITRRESREHVLL